MYFNKKTNLIYSEDLGIKQYSNINVHCCLNIYKKPINGINKNLIINLKILKLKNVEKVEINFYLKDLIMILVFVSGEVLGKK